MSKFKIAAVCCLVVAGLAASILLKHRAEDELSHKNELERQRAQQLKGLQVEHQRLAELAAQRTNDSGQAQERELQRLRAASADLRRQTNDLAARPGDRSQP